MKDELKNCPHCGETGDGSLKGNLHYVTGNQNAHRIFCAGCFAYGPAGKDNAEAARLWNARTESSDGKADRISKAAEQLAAQIGGTFQENPRKRRDFERRERLATPTFSPPSEDHRG